MLGVSENSACTFHIGFNELVNSTFCRSVGFCYVNVNAYKSKRESFERLIEECNIDILLLSETKVYSKTAVKIEGFQVFPAVRSKNCGGGLLVAIKHCPCSAVMIESGEMLNLLQLRLPLGLNKYVSFWPMDHKREAQCKTLMTSSLKLVYR